MTLIDFFPSSSALLVLDPSIFPTDSDLLMGAGTTTLGKTLASVSILVQVIEILPAAEAFCQVTVCDRNGQRTSLNLWGTQVMFSNLFREVFNHFDFESFESFLTRVEMGTSHFAVGGFLGDP